MNGSADLRRSGFRTTVALYGLAMAALVFLLKYIEYRFLLRDLSVEIYIGVVAVLFTALGIWAGSKLLQRKHLEPLPPVPNAMQAEVESPPGHSQDPRSSASLGISARELEVLQLMAKGLSNQGIADTLFISLATVKSHSSSLFGKLDVKSRTQAVLKAKDLGIIP